MKKSVVSPSRKLPVTPPSSSQKKRTPRLPKENLDPSTMPTDPSSHFRSKPLGLKSRSPLPPRPPLNHSGNPLKRKLCLETLAEGGYPASITSDSGVQVIVRIRPRHKEEEESDQIVQKISPNSTSIIDHTFTFDSVADASSTQSTAEGLSNLRTSRINLVDLAGSERQKMTGAAGERLKETCISNRSLPQLGFPTRPIDLGPSMPVVKIDIGIQTDPDSEISGDSSTYICSYGKNKPPPLECSDINEIESKWIYLLEEIRVELEAKQSLVEESKLELQYEKRCTEELNEALARILEQYADLQEKHIDLHGRHRQIIDGIEDVKKAAAKAGVRGAESKFIQSLAAEISALKAEREKERRYWRVEKKGLQAQLRDTAEAVQAAGELLVRLKEAEEAAAAAQKRASKAELETEKAYQEIDRLKNHDQQITTPKEALKTFSHADTAKDGCGQSLNDDQKWREEFAPFRQGEGELSRGTEPYLWYTDYDQCNM